MIQINTKTELVAAIAQEVDCIAISDSNIGDPLLIAGRVQMGLLPKPVLDKLAINGQCKISVGDGVLLSVDKALASASIKALTDLENSGIELDVEDSVLRKINLYYRH